MSVIAEPEAVIVPAIASIFMYVFAASNAQLAEVASCKYCVSTYATIAEIDLDVDAPGVTDPPK